MAKYFGNTLKSMESTAELSLTSVSSDFDDLYQKTLLVVDDVADNMDLLKAMLNKSGFNKILTASSGQEAIAYLQQHHINSNSLGAVLLNLMMPGMNGWEVCRLIRSNQEWADIPVILITASVNQDVVNKSIENGATDILFKPIRRRELIPRVISALAQHKSPSHQ